MAADLYASEPVFRARVDSCLELLRAHESIDLRPLMFPPAATKRRRRGELVKPSLALPALLTIELAVAEQLRAWGITPAAMLGHSMGEYAAAFLAGVFTLRDVLAVVTCRGRLFETLPDGAMLSVPLPEAEVVSELRSGLSFAASNGPGLCLVSGEVAAIAELGIAPQGPRRRSPAAADHRRGALADARSDPGPVRDISALAALVRADASLPVRTSPAHGSRRARRAIPRYWVRHLRQPVRFARRIGDARRRAQPHEHRASGGRAGPHADVARAGAPERRARRARSSRRCAICRIRSAIATCSLTAVGRLWAAGVEPNWTALLGAGRRRVSLPTYAFDHERHWIEPGNGFFLRPDTSRTLEKQADRAQWTYRPVWRPRERRYGAPPGRAQDPGLRGSRGCGPRAGARAAGRWAYRRHRQTRAIASRA